MWKSLLTGVLIAAFILALFLGGGCNALLGRNACLGIGTSLAMTIESPARHDFYVRNNVPLLYRGRHNPFKATIGNVVEGARVYDQHCARCHGVMGIGDGEAGQPLQVPPADLSRSLGQPLYRDDFFYWSISEGGAQFDTAMPSFKNELKPGEIWKAITFMRAAFAEQNAPAKDATAPP